MLEKIYFLLLILCGILCEEIIVTSSDGEPSDLLVREKRVLNLDQEGYGQVMIEEANYMTVIKEDNQANCVGVILSHYTVITAALCVTLNVSRYQLVAGSKYGRTHSIYTISTKLTNYGNPPNEFFEGIALLNVEPHFNFDTKIGSIHLYAGSLTTGTEAAVYGWGCKYPLLTHNKIQRRLRRINIPIMDRTECANVYRGRFVISHKHICTYHPRKYCTRTDLGAPLVVNNMLAGIHIHKPEIVNQINPDIFIDLQLPEYNVWIRRNARFI